MISLIIVNSIGDANGYLYAVITRGHVPVGSSTLSNSPKTSLAKNARPQLDQLFDGFNKEFRSLLNAGVTHRYKKGEIIFREGGIPNGVFIVKKGFVKKYKFTSKGEEQIYYVSVEGELFGYHAVLGEINYTDSASTLEDSQITFIPKEIFLMTIHDSSRLNARLVKLLALEFNLFKNVIAILATRSVRERLAINLLILDDKFRLPGKAGKAGEINLSRADLANIVGTAKESLVRILREFKIDGLIHIKGKIILIANQNKVIKTARLVDH
jgi:CRP-like cAMP-binding protein